MSTTEALRAIANTATTNNSIISDNNIVTNKVGVYKPHPKVYQLAVDRLGVESRTILFQSSNAWDAWAASAFGMRAVWCNRYGQRPERLPGLPDHEGRSLAELPFLSRILTAFTS
jgi:2-haloacid dehalogenase